MSTRITDLPQAEVLNGSEIMPLVQNGVTKKATLDFINLAAPAALILAQTQQVYADTVVVKEATDAVLVEAQSMVNFQQAGAGAVVRTMQDKAREVVSVKDFGAVGDGTTDDTAAIQAAINAAVGKVLLLGPNESYGITSVTIPSGVTLISNGSTFRKMVASSTAAITVQGSFEADTLRLSSPGGTTGDKALRIQGSYIHIGYFHVEADAQGVYNSTNWALEAESNQAGTVLSHIKIDNIYCKNYSTTFFGTKLKFVEVGNGIIENYRTAVYLKDTINSEFSNFKISGLGNAVNGAPGENGLLLEATTADATSDLVFNDWTVADSGEHAFRLGGQQTIKNVWFNRCKSRRSGSSILTGNLSSGEWHGGCGFKILGGASVGGTRHKNIYLNQCQVYDVNQTAGSYPAGHGVNNFTPFMVVCADGVYLNECIVGAEELPTAARNGIIVGHCTGVYLNGCDFRQLGLIAIKPYQETLFAGFPGYATPLEEFHIRGGKYEVVGSGGANSGVVFYMEEPALYAHKNWTINGTEMRGGSAAMRIEDLGAGGSYAGCRANFTYLDPTTVTDAAATAPAVQGSGMLSWLIDLTSNARPNSFGMSVANGSVHRQMDAGLFRLRKANNWVTL